MNSRGLLPHLWLISTRTELPDLPLSNSGDIELLGNTF